MYRLYKIRLDRAEKRKLICDFAKIRATENKAMNFAELYDKITEIIPEELREEWDNDGIMCSSDTSSEVRRVLVTLDVTESIVDYAKKLTSQIPVGKNFRAQTCLMESVGMSGRVSFDCFLCQATRLYLIDDCRGIAIYLTEALYRLAMEKKLQVRVCRNPILPDFIDGIFFSESGIAVAIRPHADVDIPHHRISMRRFLKTSDLQRTKEASAFDERMMRAMLQATLEEMEVVRAAHFALEEIYSSSMNFEKKEEFTKSFCTHWFDLKNS